MVENNIKTVHGCKHGNYTVNEQHRCLYCEIEKKYTKIVLNTSKNKLMDLFIDIIEENKDKIANDYYEVNKGF